MLAFLIACFGLYVVFSAWKNNCDVDSDIIFNPRKSTDINEINEWNKNHPDDTVEL